MEVVTKYTLEVRPEADGEEEKISKTSSICGWYTKDSEGNYCEDVKYIKYLHMPEDVNNVNFDLKKAHENDVHKPQSEMSENIDSLLKWLSLHSIDETAGLAGVSKLPEFQFVCFRGLLSRIMWSPYERSDSLMLCAVKLKGTIYLCQFATQENKDQMKKMDTEEMRAFTRYGFKFEQYMLSDCPGQSPDTDQPLSEYEEMCCVFSTTLGSHKIMYGAEVDGLPDKEALSDLTAANLVELKTCKENPSEYSFHRYKLIKWWVQSWLANINSVIVGYRNQAGVVNKLEQIKVEDMPKIAKGRWEADCCIKFANDFLNFVKHVMCDAPDDDPKAVYQFQFSPSSSEVFIGKKLPNNHKCNFIPEWYMEWLQSIK